ITLDAMQAFERRAIHLALEGDPEVTSSSIGEEPERRVVVGLRKPAAEKPMPGWAAAVRIRKAIALIYAVEDGAGDEEITPTEIAEAIRDCLELREVDLVPNVRRYLGEALDAVSDGMPADFVAMTLYAA